tara:strand:+ start:312 stop:776 length:465 start_codon:yes stop_codon:yes gene_type:complete
MPSQSKSQQRFFGVVKAMQKGDIPKKGRAGKIAKSMDKDDVDKYAKTKHKGLPNKVKREQRVRNLIKKMVREELENLSEKIEPSKAVKKVLDMADGGFGKLGGRTVDGLSANLFKAVYNKANDTNLEKINKMNEKQLYTFMTKIWSKFGKQVRL